MNSKGAGAFLQPHYLSEGIELMRIVWFLLILVFSFSATADPSNDFEKLKSLVGEWKKEGSDSKDFYISFQSSANGSVLIENWIYKGASHSFTVYHLDGESLLATHYCPQGNQPRLKLGKSSDPNSISFEFQDATNLKSLKDSHQHSLSFEFLDNNTILRNESYSKAGKLTPASLNLVRQ
ncbi:hypothetical protein ACONUD_10005 [Microbulbifer harenosus]|uniref:Uncharacterized protein n=1 Tax=Microbulbifer harenosus TaxID=2576840 RepID=A0ABY2UGG4_9GAMM|nr:hypothetical protein [Microbulbifer harenosus]TLM76866.1 hypothetical protein FDY93_10825 [Microbulbifer harenosus]